MPLYSFRKIDIHYHDWLDFTRCPRMFGYRAMGYEQPATYKLKPAMVRGRFVHAGIAGHFKDDVDSGLKEQLLENIQTVERIQDTKEQTYQESLVMKSLEEAKVLLHRYIESLAKDITEVVESERQIVVPFYDADNDGDFKWLVAKPDCIAIVQGKLTLLDFKVSESPDQRSLDLSGQVDFYCLMYKLKHDKDIAYVAYDIITPELVTRYTRRPNWYRAAYIMGAIKEMDFFTIEALLEKPVYRWDCGRCPFYRPCAARENGANDLEILEKFYEPLPEFKA